VEKVENKFHLAVKTKVIHQVGCWGELFGKMKAQEWLQYSEIHYDNFEK